MSSHAPISTCLPTLGMQSTMIDSTIDPIDAVDHLVVMQRQEATYRCGDQLQEYWGTSFKMRSSKCDPSTTAVMSLDAACESPLPLEVDHSCRQTMCEWCYSIVDCLSLDRETVCIAMSYLDRFLCTKNGHNQLLSKSAFQLASATALYIAIKINEPVELDLNLLVDVSRNRYTVSQIQAMEFRILSALNWRMNPPTPMSFANHLLALLPSTIDCRARQMMFDIVRYQTELSVFDYFMSTMIPSHIAMGSILNAMEKIDALLFPHSLQTVFLLNLWEKTGIDVDTREIVESRERLLATFEEAKTFQERSAHLVESTVDR